MPEGCEKMSKQGDAAYAWFLKGYNCSQSVVAAFAPQIGLTEETALRLSAGFGAGIGRMREVCGAFCGVVTVLSMVYADPADPKDKSRMYALVQQAAEQSAAPTAQEPAPVKVTEINASEPQAAPVVQSEQEVPAQASPAVPMHESAESAASASPSTETAPVTTVQVVDEDRKTPAFRVVGEAFKTYILVEIENNLYYIDKHAAHERMNFDKLKNAQEPPMRQTLLAPIAAELSREDGALLLENLPLLEQFGFACEDFGAGALLVREVPADIDAADTVPTLEEFAERLRTGRSPDEKREALLHTMACKAAIKGGWVSDPAELRVLVDRVQSGEIKYCPHGRPVAVKLTKYELEKMFKRA